MTRYARAQGSKACNSRQACPATPWQELKQQMTSGKSSSEQANTEDNPAEEEKVVGDDSESKWFSFQTESKPAKKNVQGPKPNYESKRAKSVETAVDVSSEETSVDSNMRKTELNGSGSTKTIEKSHKNKSFKKKNMQKCITSSGAFKVIESVPSIKKQIREKKSPRPTVRPKEPSKPREIDLKDSRRIAKALKREKKKVCFCCRRFGHQLADCPESQKDNNLEVMRSPGVFCYNCGSTEHRMSRCNKPGKKTFKFAHCFVCGEEGHLARACPDNPKGNYPKGGSCHLCGEVTHMKSECPKAKGSTMDFEPTLACTTSGPIESLPEDIRTPSKPPTKLKKIVQFT